MDDYNMCRHRRPGLEYSSEEKPRTLSIYADVPEEFTVPGNDIWAHPQMDKLHRGSIRGFLLSGGMRIHVVPLRENTREISGLVFTKRLGPPLRLIPGVLTTLWDADECSLACTGDEVWSAIAENCVVSLDCKTPEQAIQSLRWSLHRRILKDVAEQASIQERLDVAKDLLRRLGK